MRKVLALVRASWLAAASYRVGMAMSLASLLLTIVPLYFVANALQPVMAESIRTEGSQYFAFALVGLISIYFISTAVTSLPAALGSGIMNGTLEALLSTPTSLPTLFAGLTGYSFLWSTLKAIIALTMGWALGAQIAWDHALMAAIILLLIIFAHIPVGILSAALFLAFRTAGPLPQGVLTLSVLLGGVYYPTHVIPSWLESVSGLMPLTYGLRALRRVLLEGMSLPAVATDLAVLTAFAVVLFAGSSLIFAFALNYARRTGSLAQY